VGLLEKTLKKTGQERKTPSQATKTEEKPSVGWLGRSFSERTSALADKIDLESQYARLEAITQTGTVPPPPKASLRERAKKFLSGLATPVRTTRPDIDTRPKMSLRQRAAQILRKISTPSGSEGGATPGVGSAGQGSLPPGQDDDIYSHHFFPWHTLSDEGALQSHIAFGEEGHLPETEAVAVVAEPPPPEPPKSPLTEFTDTMERITENLKNLHVQLDSGNFIRDIQVEGPARPQQPAQQIISHHVPVDEVSATPGGAASGVAGSGGVASGGVAAVAPPAQEKPRDVFWPKDLPLDLPARDVRINADGTISVVPGPFQLPYLAEDIAPPESDISHFTRNLKNAELFIAEGELQLTRIIYERLLEKIIDAEARRKIRANLEALDNYRKSHDWGNFMPIPPWQRWPNNPWQDMKPPQVNVSEMPVEAKNITINLDKGFFEIAKALFEIKKTLDGTEGKGEEGAQEGAADEAEGLPEAEAEDKRSGDDRRVGADDRRKGGPDTRGEGAPERRSGEGRRAEDAQGGAGDAAGDEAAAEAGDEDQRVGEDDRRKGGPDPRGEGAEERRSGGDRRGGDEGLPQNAPPPPLAADGQSAEEPPADGVMEPPKIPEMSPDGQPIGGEDEEGGGEEKEEENKVQEIRGVLELKTPDQEDTPFLTLTYDFTKIPHAYRLAKDNGIFEYAYYKYKPMLVKAHQFIKRKQISRALNYYRVIREQQIPTEFRHMVDRNIKDITEYLQKYLVTRAS